MRWDDFDTTLVDCDRDSSEMYVARQCNDILGGIFDIGYISDQVILIRLDP
jgi:hypothetical protein